MLRVGLTGGIASGKSTVSSMLEKLGAHVLDSDRITHELFRPGTAVNAAVIAAFGPTVVASDGSIDRKKLGDIVFSNPELRQKLNSLVHPAIKERQSQFLDQVGAMDSHAIGIIEAALMVEAGTYSDYDKLIVVACSPAVQRQRLRARSALTTEQIESRIASQMPMEEKIRVADFVVDNSGEIEDTRKQVERVYEELRKMLDKSI